MSPPTRLAPRPAIRAPLARHARELGQPFESCMVPHNAIPYCVFGWSKKVVSLTSPTTFQSGTILSGMVTRRPIRVYSNIGPQLAAKRPAVSSSRRRRSPCRPRPSRLLSPTQPTLSTAHLRPRALTHIRRVGIPPPTPANNARTSGETARRRLVAAGEVGGQVGAQGHQSTAAEGMARPSRRRCRRAEPSAAGRGNLRPACAGQKLWPPMEAGARGGRGPSGGCSSPLETLAADPPPLPTGRPPWAGKAIAMGGGGPRTWFPPAEPPPRARPSAGALGEQRWPSSEAGARWGRGRGGWRSKRRVLL